MGLDPKSTVKEKVSVWMVVALMMGVVGLLGGPEKGEMFFFLTQLMETGYNHAIYITAGTIVMDL